ncbi:MAG: flavodoxin [Victivallaceae bacterium]|nr:flavodoxin [Victivallaceae bacterium]
MNHLTVKEQKLAAIAAYAANGDLPELKKALAAGLDAGLTVNGIKEILVQAYAYCGFPRSLNALGTFMALEHERGNKDPEGKLPGPLPAGKSIDFGAANQTKLCGAPVKGALFEFAPAIDEYLKAHLFGDIFARDNVDWRTRELATIAMLGAMTGVKPQLEAHISIGKRNGLSDAEIGEILAIAQAPAAVPPKTSAFPVGRENTAYAKYFTGKSYLAPLTGDKRLNTPVFNVTFEPGCRNNWHKHTGGQMLIAVGGVGYYQERGQKARRLVPGDVVEIPPDAEHWHGAAPNSWFSHLAVECNPQTNQNTWLEPVSDADYLAATRPGVLSPKVLVVYFSWSGNTRQVAGWIRETVQGDLAELKVVTPYPANYRSVVAQARREINDGVKPPLSTRIEDMAKYDTIFVGTPNWCSTMAPPVATFLTGYDFSGKTLIPFVTHGGGGEAACASDMKKLAPKATFRKALVIRGNDVAKSKAEVIEWAAKIVHANP